VDDPSQRPLSRRTFLGIVGAAGAAGVAGCSARPAVQKLVPYLVPPEDAIPGTPLFYRTACRECPAGCGVTARTREGRVVKLEGNPDDPVGRGALCARGQAALQALYHPDRFRGPLARNGAALTPIGWDEAEARVVKAVAEAGGRGPGRVRLLTRLEPGAGAAAQRAFLAAAGGRPSDRVVLEPLDPSPLRAATGALFGARELPTYDLSSARSVVAFGAEFVESWRSPVELARQLAAARGVIGERRVRFTWVGPRLSLTGVSADHWIRARSGGELAVALGALRTIVDPAARVSDVPADVRGLWPELERLAPSDLAARAGVAWREIEELGRELARRRPCAILAPGAQARGRDATQLAAVALLIDHALGSFGHTVRLGLDRGEDAPSPLGDVQGLLADLGAGRVDLLLVHGVDPVGVLPATLGAAAALGRVPLVVSLALRPDATTAHAHLVLPDHHALESFGEVEPRRGVLNLLQPVMTPLADTRQAAQVLLEIAKQLPGGASITSSDPYDLVAARVAERAAQDGAAPADPTAALRSAFERGGVWSGPPATSAPRLLPAAARPFLALGAPLPSAPQGVFDLVVFPTSLRGGHGADLPWLSEIPDALSSVSWTPWLEVSPGTAARLGLRTGDRAAVSTPAGRAELPVYVFPGIRDDAVAFPLGGLEAAALLPALADTGSGALAFAGTRATVARAGRGTTRLPILEGSPYQHGREVVPVVTAAEPSPPRPDLSARMYAEPKHPEHRWAMAIDLDRCTGCQACVVACFAENNVPVMGPQAASEGRYMGWLRVERYLGDEPGGALDVRFLLMLCQHCTNAPCEPVCPVYATYHTPEGLNAQVYNRCVGTRYCSNNCPYKVRTFNWRDAQFARPLDMQLNPDVTVRSRGVMEKCTFCVQRIRYAERKARDEERPIADGEVVPACAQTCPSHAIVFGDANDPASHVATLARDRRAFRALEEVGTSPAITYLARVREEGTS
jgi:anaerobic selenocysteine-containing dehydrogenase/Fe-S-cluster-containing dehydrogenase component